MSRNSREWFVGMDNYRGKKLSGTGLPIAEMGRGAVRLAVGVVGGVAMAADRAVERTVELVLRTITGEPKRRR